MALDTNAIVQRHVEDYGDVGSSWVGDASVPTTAWDAYDHRWVATTDSEPVTLTTSTEVDAGSGIRLMKTAANAAGTGSHREWLLRSDRNFAYSEIRSVMYGHGTWTGGDTTQQGHVHRAQKYGNGRMRGFVAWHDVVFGIPWSINVGIWEAGFGVDNLNLHHRNGVLPLSPAPRHPVTHSSRTSDVVSIYVPGRHYITVNDHIATTLPAGDLGNTNATVTSVNGPLITYADTGTNSTNGGGGVVQKNEADLPHSLLNAFPLILASRLLHDDILQAKVWRLGEAEPPWSTGVTYVAGEFIQGQASFQPQWLPTGPGLSGLLVGHINDSESVRFGNPQIRQLAA